MHFPEIRTKLELKLNNRKPSGAGQSPQRDDHVQHVRQGRQHLESSLVLRQQGHLF